MKSPKSPAPAASADSGTVNRVLRILSCFAEKETWGLNELSRTLNLPRASTHRLLNLCKPLNFLAQDAEGQYVPGIELYRLSARLADGIPINRLATPILEAVRDQTDETAMLTLLVRSELKMFFSLVASPPHPMRYLIEKNRLQPLTWGASGRSLLAFLRDDEIEEAIRREEPSPLDGRPLDAVELRASLEEIRARGFSLTLSQRSPGTYGVAVPFFDAHGDVRGNINLAIPDFRYEEHRLDEMVRLLRTATADISRRLGGK